MNKQKLVIFSGAGLDKESGVNTFRDTNDGLWYNYKVEDVATIEGWRKDPAKVLEFHNIIRRELPNYQPNEAHKALVELETVYDVVHITQNVTDLIDRAGSNTVLHLHGELTKARPEHDSKQKHVNNVIDIGYNDIVLGDKDDVYGSQIRPHIVWFGEYPFRVYEALGAVHRADVLLIIGTSLQITYTLDMIRNVKPECRIIYIDPNPMHYLDNYGLTVEYVLKGAVEGVREVVDKLLSKTEA